MTATTWARTALAATSAALLAGLALPPGPVRALLTIGFLLVVPGMVIVRLLNLPGTLNQFVLAIALSVAVETGGALIMVYTHTWSPDTLLGILCAGCGLGVLAETRRDRRAKAVPAAA
jgi:hypothetical protein